ncbi:MAG: DUF402 domain-containing protein [Bacilli bacterium]
MQIGDKYKIHCYKHNGKIHRAWEETIILDIKDDYIVCGNSNVLVTESDGAKRTTREPAIMFFYKNEWFNIIAQLKPFGLYYYCNIASPYIIDEDVIKYIDYDLDLRVFSDGGFKVLDRNEYKYHKKIMNYSSELDTVINMGLSKLLEIKKKNQFPFQEEVINKYYDEYKKYLKE